MRLAQQLAVALNVGPFPRWFQSLYGLGLARALRALSGHPAVHSIYGCGSFFEGGCLYGHSDIDLIIVLRESAPREEGLHHEVARRYNRVRRLFPFLGRWGEKEASLVFLADVASGYPVLESFRVRMKQGRLRRLWGEPFPIPLTGEPVTASEVLAECDAILHVALSSGTGAGGRTQLFWKRLFGKVERLAESLFLAPVAEAIRADRDRWFGDGTDRALFFAAADPDASCSRLLRHVRVLLDAMAAGEPPVALRFRLYHSGAGDVAAGHASDVPGASDLAGARGVRGAGDVPREGPAPDAGDLPGGRDGPRGAGAVLGAGALPPRVAAVLAAAGVPAERVRMLPSVPIGLAPRLYYFPLERGMPVATLAGPALSSLARLVRAMRRHGEHGDAVLADTEGWLVIVTRQGPWVDLVTLSPLAHANAYAWVRGEAACALPRSVHDELRREAAQLFSALRHAYARNTAWIPKLSVPCVYREDDLDTARNALHTLRSLAACSEERAYLLGPDDVIRFYRERYPACAPFLDDLLDDFQALAKGDGARPPARNLYRCLHQFMTQVLDGVAAPTLDDPRRHLGITVGIITRNRAADLAEALESLTHQVRPPDEVLLVDNGSTDHTRAVVERFAPRLPLRYLYLAEPGIPGARNLVLAEAKHEVVAFTDDDCWVEPEWLAAVERGFLRADNVGIVGGWVLHWPAPHPTTVDAYFGTFHHNKP